MISLFRMINLVLIVMLATIIAIVLLSMEIEIRYNHNRYQSANNSFLTHSNKVYRSNVKIDPTWHEQILIKSKLKSTVLNDQIIDNDMTRFKDATAKTSTALFSSKINQQRQILPIQPLLSNFSRRNEQQSSIRVTPTSLYPSISPKTERVESFILSLSRLPRLQIPSFTDKQIISSSSSSSSMSIISKSQSSSLITPQKLSTKMRKKRNNRLITLIRRIITTKTTKPRTVSHGRKKTTHTTKQKISTPKVLKKTVAKSIDFGRKEITKSSKSTKLITTIKSSRRTKPTVMPAKDKLFIPKKPMYITIRSRDVIVSHMSRKTTIESNISVKRKSSGKGGLIGGIIGGIIVFLIIGAIFGFIYYRKIKKHSTKSQKQKDEGKPGVFSVILPQVSDTPWAPDVINAQQFQYKGPLNLCISHPTDLKHDLENSVVESPSADAHIVFDDNLNQVYEIGSEIEILIDQKIVQNNKNLNSDIN